MRAATPGAARRRDATRRKLEALRASCSFIGRRARKHRQTQRRGREHTGRKRKRGQQPLVASGKSRSARTAGTATATTSATSTLSGTHARHVERVLYVYNLHLGSIQSSQRETQLGCEKRIRSLERYRPLTSLEG